MREWLIKKRKELGITQSELALRLGISQQYVSLIEKGNRQEKITVDLIYKLAEVLKISIEDVFYNEKLLFENRIDKNEANT